MDQKQYECKVIERLEGSGLDAKEKEALAAEGWEEYFPAPQPAENPPREATPGIKHVYAYRREISK